MSGLARGHVTWRFARAPPRARRAAPDARRDEQSRGPGILRESTRSSKKPEAELLLASTELRGPARAEAEPRTTPTTTLSHLTDLVTASRRSADQFVDGSAGGTRVAQQQVRLVGPRPSHLTAHVCAQGVWAWVSGSGCQALWAVQALAPMRSRPWPSRQSSRRRSWACIASTRPPLRRAPQPAS